MLLHDVITKDHFAHANDYLQDEGRGYPSNLVDFGNNNLNQLTSLPSRYLSSQSSIGDKSQCSYLATVFLDLDNRCTQNSDLQMAYIFKIASEGFKVI